MNQTLPFVFGNPLESILSRFSTGQDDHTSVASQVGVLNRDEIECIISADSHLIFSFR